MKTVKEIIAAHPQIKRRQKELDDIQKVQRQVERVLQAQGMSADSCRVDRLVNRELRLIAASAAASVCIRQILPTLQRTLNSCGILVDNISVITLKIPD